MKPTWEEVEKSLAVMRTSLEESKKGLNHMQDVVKKHPKDELANWMVEFESNQTKAYEIAIYALEKLKWGKENAKNKNRMVR